MRTKIPARAACQLVLIFVVAGGAHAINKSLYSKLPYDPVTDFAPVVMVGSSPDILVKWEKVVKASGAKVD